MLRLERGLRIRQLLTTPEITLDCRQVVSDCCDGGVLGSVCGFGDGQGPFGQRAGRGRITELAQDPGEGVQVGGDGGVVGPVCRFGDRQGPFGQRAGRSRITELAQDPGEGVQVGGDGGVVGSYAVSMMARVRSASGRAAATSPSSCNNGVAQFAAWDWPRVCSGRWQ